MDEKELKLYEATVELILYETVRVLAADEDEASQLIDEGTLISSSGGELVSYRVMDSPVEVDAEECFFYGLESKRVEG